MATSDLHAQAATVRADLTRLEADLKALLTTVGGGIGAAIHGRVAEPLKALSGHVEPLLNLLGAASGPAAPAKRGPGRPRKDAPAPAAVKRGPGRPRKDAIVAAAPAPAAAPKKKRPGGRGRKANLTADAIQAALKQTGGVKSRAADVLGVSQPTLYNYLKALGLGAKKKAGGRPAKMAKKAK